MACAVRDKDLHIKGLLYVQHEDIQTVKKILKTLEIIAIVFSRKQFRHHW